MKKTKRPDCIRLKRRVQEGMLAEYEARKDEFKSCADFIFATADESAEIRARRERMAGAKRAAKP